MAVASGVLGHFTVSMAIFADPQMHRAYAIASNHAPNHILSPAWSVVAL
jgi:hypothetical protein